MVGIFFYEKLLHLIWINRQVMMMKKMMTMMGGQLNTKSTKRYLKGIMNTQCATFYNPKSPSQTSEKGSFFLLLLLSLWYYLICLCACICACRSDTILGRGIDMDMKIGSGILVVIKRYSIEIQEMFK